MFIMVSGLGNLDLLGRRGGLRFMINKLMNV